MTLMPIRIFGDPVLREKSKSIDKTGDQTQQLAHNMAETMYEASGIGLAAPQIGIPKRLIVVDMGENEFVAYLNPEIIYFGEKEDVDEEGCLCLPEIRVPVKRALKIGFKAFDLKGRPIELEASDLLARVLQHEVDHIEGFTILDRTTPEEKQKAIRQFLNMQEQLKKK